MSKDSTNALQRFEAFLTSFLTRERSAASRYSVTVLLTVLSLTILGVSESLRSTMLYLPFIALIFSAIYGGAGPALLMSAAAVLCLDYFLIPPTHVLFDSPAAILRWPFYLLTVGMVAAAVELLKKNYRSAMATRQLAVEASEEKDALIRIIAHDLRNPLGAVTGMSDLLLTESLDEDERRKFLKRIRGAAAETLLFIDDLLTSASPSRLPDHERVSFDLVALAREVTAFQKLYGERKNIRIVAEFGTDFAPVAGVRCKIFRVLQNLVDNAVKYSPPGSVVRLRLSSTADGVLCEVEDQGPGIHPDDLGDLFKPFGLTRNQPTLGERSTGLGLAICRKFVEMHDGRLGLINKYPHGCMFYFLLPHAAESAEGHQAHHLEHHVDAHQSRQTRLIEGR